MNKSFYSIALLAFAGAATFSACSNNDDLYQGDQTVKEYEENFKNTFGNIDPSQDWNMATRGSVTVNVPTTSDVEIYTANSEGNYELIGNYKKVSGTQTLAFDIAKGKSDILVSANHQALFTNLGGTIDFSSTTKAVTRTMREQNIATVTSDYKNIPEDVVKSFNENILPEGKENLGNVTQNFKFVSKGEFVIYPMYWQTASQNALGVYWTDAQGANHEQEIYMSQEGGELLVPCSQDIWCDSNAKVGEYCEAGKHLVSEVVKSGDGNWHEHKAEWCTPEQIKPGDSGLNAVMSKGIKINLPVGTEFGMFIHTYDRGALSLTRYSEASKNEAIASTVSHNNGKNTQGTYVFASYFKTTVDSKTYTFLGFEDWASDVTDLNDLIFMFDTDNVDMPTPTVIDKDKSTESSWIIACEDLGDTDDYDFNDVVLKVSHVSGQPTATVTPLAAGGTLATDVYVGTENKGEIHKLINGTEGESGSLPMLNTDGGSNPGPGASFDIAVNSNFSLAPSTDAQGFGDIKLVVHQTDEEGATAKTIQAPATGGVPQMFLVSGSWKWPKERKKIEAAYSGFLTWVSNAQFDWTSAEKNSELIYGAE